LKKLQLTNKIIEMSTLIERIRNEKHGSRRRTKVMTFEAPGGGRRKMSMPKLTSKRSRNKSQKISQAERKTISKITMAGDSQREAMQRVIFNVALNRQEPKEWPGIEDEDCDNSNLDKLLSTYWGEKDHLLKDESLSKNSQTLISKETKIFPQLTTPTKKFKSSLGSRRARMIMENLKSSKQTNKDALVEIKMKLLGKTKQLKAPPSELTTPETSLFKDSSLDSSLQLEQASLKSSSKMDILKAKFSVTEAIFRFCQGRGQLGQTFNELKDAVERTTKKQFTTPYIGRLLRLVPDLYEVKWVQQRTISDEKNWKFDYELQITPKNHVARSQGDNSLQFMNKEQGTARAKLFINRVEAYTRAAHRKWCREHGVKPPVGRYHSDFNPEDVEVKPKIIPEKPRRTELSAREALLKYSRRSKIVSGRIQRKLAKLSTAERSGLSRIVRDSMARYKAQQPKLEQKEEEKDILDMTKIPESLRSLPRETLLKLQGKSKARKILKVDKATQNKKKMLEQLPELVRVIKVFFRSNKRTAMPYRVFVMKMAGKIKSKPSPRTMEKMVEQLCNIVPEFCETVTGVLKVFRLKNKCDSSKIFRKIKKAIQNIDL